MRLRTSHEQKDRATNYVVRCVLVVEKPGFPPEEASYQADEFFRKRYREKIGVIQRFARNIKTGKK